MIRQISIQWSHKLPYHAVDRRKLEAFFHFFSFFIFIFTVAQNLTGNSYYNHFKIILKDNMKRQYWISFIVITYQELNSGRRAASSEL